ncbi:MAG: hypothetical protein ACREP1_01105, partial [Rhodanobacteraceae bacterium]
MKLFARTTTRKKSPGAKKQRRGWRWLIAILLLGIPAIALAVLLASYAIWAQTFDLKRLGPMPERNTVF